MVNGYHNAFIVRDQGDETTVRAMPVYTVTIHSHRVTLNGLQKSCLRFSATAIYDAA